jgi:glycosyltransferase involved in cell wall biosynthesis
MELLARNLGVHDRVCFLGRVARPDTLVAIAQAQVLLFPSTHDSLPWVVAESISLGTPVVCIDRGGPAELVCATGLGLAVPVSRRTIDDLAAAILQVVPVSPDFKRFDKDLLAERLQNLYREVEAQ